MINKIIEKNLIKIYYSFSYNQKNSSYKKNEKYLVKEKMNNITNKTKIKYNIIIVILMDMLYNCEYFKNTFKPYVI